MTHPLRMSLVPFLVAAALSCSGETPGPEVAGLLRALQQEFPDGRFEARLATDSRHLEIMVDTAAYGNFRLDDARRRALGQDMARIAMDYLGATSPLDSISVQFVQERSGGLLSRSWSMMEEKYAVADFR